MRVLHTADWHFGRTLEGRSRLPEQEAFIDELAAIVRDQQIDLVLVAGDIYDSVNPPAAAEQLFYDALARLSDQGSRPVYVIAGNHDHPDRLAAAAPLALKLGVTLVGLPEARVYKSAIKRTGETAIVFALPYPSESRLRELLSDEAEEGLLRWAYSARVKHIVQEQARHYRKDTVNLLMSHLYVLGGKETESERPIQVGGAYTVDTEALTAGAQYVALGHLHRPQYIRSGTMIRYSGSPLAYSFSEAGQAKSVTILDIKPGSVPQVEEIFLSSGRPLVEWKAKGGLAEVHRWLDEGKDPTAGSIWKFIFRRRCRSNKSTSFGRRGTVSFISGRSIRSCNRKPWSPFPHPGSRWTSCSGAFTSGRPEAHSPSRNWSGCFWSCWLRRTTRRYKAKDILHVGL